MQQALYQPDPDNAGGGGDPLARNGRDEHTPTSIEERLMLLRRRLMRQASMAVSMLETSLEALWTGDTDLVQNVRDRDDRVDLEEVLLEEACFELMTLQGPFARDFREIAFVLKANQDIERVADHACSIAKIARDVADDQPETWPTALREMAERVPGLCHRLLRAVIDEDLEAARGLVKGDKTIDRLDKRLFAECAELIERDPKMAATGMRIARLGRELERIGDLMVNIAEDVVYLATGNIIRHEHGKQKPA